MNKHFTMPIAKAIMTIALFAFVFIGENFGQCTNNLLENSGFENGLQGWSATGNITITTDAYTGSSAAESCGAASSISQVFPATVGQEYTGSLWGKGTLDAANPVAPYVWLRFLRADYSPIVNGPVTLPERVSFFSADYTLEEVSAVAPADAAYVHLLVWKEEGACFTIDDLELCEGAGAGSNKPDLFAKDFTITSNVLDPLSGDTEIGSTFDLVNQGTGETQGNFYVQYYLSTDQLKSADDLEMLEVIFTEPMLPGASLTQQNLFKVPSNFAPAGNYYLLVCVDDDDTEDESNEVNNCRYLFVEIFDSGSDPLPDLVIANGSATPDVVIQGDQVNYSLDIENNGTAPVNESVNIQVFSGIGQLGITSDIPLNIPVGGSQTVNFDFSMGFPPGLYDLTFVIDVFDYVEELNEQNNTFSLPITVLVEDGGGIDLELTAIANPPNPDIWDDTAVEFVLTNNGDDMATDVVVRFDKPADTKYVGGNEYTASQGVLYYGAVPSAAWDVGNIPPGGSATLTTNLFMLTDEQRIAYAEVVEANEIDIDSNPLNGTPPTPNEDDEAAVTINGPAIPCLLNAEFQNKTCDDNGTPNDINDDTFTFDIYVDGIGTSVAGWTANVGGTTVSGSYGVPQNVGPYLIADGNVPVNIYDNDTPSCQAGGLSVPPNPCSDGTLNCMVNVQSLGKTCDDNGTPNDPNDDVFYVEILVTGTNTGNAGWQTVYLGTPVYGDYGQAQTFGPYPITNGDAVFFVRDVEFDYCNQQLNVTSPAPCSNQGSEIDLELTLSQSVVNPDQWENYSVLATIENKGPQTATQVSVSFPKPDGVVYTGGNEFTASQGDFYPGGSEIWSVGSIPAGGSATFQVNYFLLEDDAPVAYAQVFNAAEQDIDSSPDNGTPPSVNEDDEASTYSDPVFLDLQVLNALPINGIVMPGDNLTGQFSIDYAGPFATVNFKYAAYLSDDPVLSADDYFINNQLYTVTSFPSGIATPFEVDFTMPSGLPDGQIYFLAVVDPNDEFVEANEANNVGFNSFWLDNGNGNLPDLQLTLETDASMTWPNWSRMYVTATLENTGAVDATGVEVAFSDLQGAEVFTDPTTHIASQGLFDLFAQNWEVGTVPPNGVATLTIRLNENNDPAYQYFAQVSYLNEADNDSSPGNASCCTPQEDDEAVVPPGPCNIEAQVLQVLDCIDYGGATDELIYEMQVTGSLGGFHGYYGEPGPIYTFDDDATFERTVPRYETRPDVIIDNADPKCQTVLSFPKPPCNSSGIDLELAMTASDLSPDQWSNVEVTITASNQGSEPATGVWAVFQKPTGVVYTGGNEWTASQGTFAPFGNEWWNISTLQPGASATLTVSYFTLTENAITPWAEITDANEQDTDSTPANGACCTPNEDDEATLFINNFNNGGGSNNFKIFNDRQRMAFDKIYPTPAKYWVTMDVYSKEGQSAVLAFYDQQGRSVYRMEVELEEGRNEIGLDISTWRSGNYNVIGYGNGTPAYGRMVKVWE